MDFKDKLKELRLSENLSQKKLADSIGVAQSSINYWEKGQRTPSIGAVQKLAEYFDIDVSELLAPDTYKAESSALLGENIKSLRKEKGYSIKKLSELTGIPSATLEQYENKSMTPKGNNIIKLASILDPIGHKLLSSDDLPFCLYSSGEDIDSIIFGYNHIANDKRIRPEELTLLNDFRKLNELGQSEAKKRVSELTEIVRYLKIEK